MDVEVCVWACAQHQHHRQRACCSCQLVWTQGCISSNRNQCIRQRQHEQEPGSCIQAFLADLTTEHQQTEKEVDMPRMKVQFSPSGDVPKSSHRCFKGVLGHNVCFTCSSMRAASWYGVTACEAALIYTFRLRDRNCFISRFES
jgi:hypothetical protein